MVQVEQLSDVDEQSSNIYTSVSRQSAYESMIKGGEDDDYEDIDEERDEYEEDEEYSSGNGSWTNSIRRLIPSSFRRVFGNASAAAHRLFLSSWCIVGSAAWIITTSLILIGLPVLYAYDREQNLVAMEKEQQRFSTDQK